MVPTWTNKDWQTMKQILPLLNEGPLFVQMMKICASKVKILAVSYLELEPAV
jgi:hypothetical protein